MHFKKNPKNTPKTKSFKQTKKQPTIPVKEEKAMTQRDAIEEARLRLQAPQMEVELLPNGAYHTHNGDFHTNPAASFYISKVDPITALLRPIRQLAQGKIP